MQNITVRNQTFNLKELFLANILTTSFGGGVLSTYIILPLSALGTIFNTVSLLIFLKRSFRKIALFKYMKVYTMSSLIINSILIFAFYFNVTQFFELSISYSARIFRCVILPYVVVFFFSFENMIEILINVERAVNFSTSYQWFKKAPAYLVCFITLVLCVIIYLPGFFIYEIVPNSELFVKFRLCVPSSFTKLPVVKISQIVSYVIQGPIIMILVVITNVFSLISFRNYTRKKAETTRELTNLNRNKQRRQKKLDKMDKKLLWMTFYLTTYSVIMHIIQFASLIIIFYIGTSPVLISLFTFLLAFIMTLKNSTNILFYYIFNKNFRNALKLCNRKTQNDYELSTNKSNNENSTRTFNN